MSKFYAVIGGHSQEPRILTTWAACQKEVTGAKGVKFKSFPTEEGAREFLRLHGEEVPGKPASKEAVAAPVVLGEEEIVVYVDGSYEEKTGRYAYGLVAVVGDEEIYTDAKAFKSEYSSMRNVAGEVLGAITAMKYAKAKGFRKLHLHFDYQGIESWALGTWKRNNPLTAGYHTFFQDMKKDLQVKFIKVKGHSGDRFNDRADELAKSAFLV